MLGSGHLHPVVLHQGHTTEIGMEGSSNDIADRDGDERHIAFRNDDHTEHRLHERSPELLRLCNSEYEEAVIITPNTGQSRLAGTKEDTIGYYRSCCARTMC
jgi:hypothetical protein